MSTMSTKSRQSNENSKIDIISYRAYKNLINTGKANSPNKTAKSNQMNNFNFNLNKDFNKNPEGIKKSTQDLTKSVFSSNTKRFTWQTDEKINRGSILTGSIKDTRNSHLKSGNWDGLTCKVQTDKYAKYANNGIPKSPSGGDNNNRK